MRSPKMTPLVLLIVATSCGDTQPGKKTLYEGTSPYNTVIVTEDDGGLRTLRFEHGGARQSVVKVGAPEHVELAYAKVMPLGLLFVEKPQEVLIVGLGGGTIPSFLHHHFPKMTIDAVDIDPVVVDVAKKYFAFKEDETLHAHVADGRAFIEKCNDRYDVIFLDAFNANSVPYTLATREFLLSVREALTPEGVVVSNVWGRNSNRLYDDMVRTYQDVFEELYVVDVRGASNKILIALPRSQSIELDDLAERAEEISTRNQFSFDMGKAVKYGFRPTRGDGAKGRVLTDADKPADKE
jgi:spermidine synthase